MEEPGALHMMSKRQRTALHLDISGDEMVNSMKQISLDLYLIIFVW